MEMEPFKLYYGFVANICFAWNSNQFEHNIQF